MMKKMMTAIGMGILAVTLLIGASPAFAASKAPKIKEIEAKTSGKVEVDFTGDVEYGNVKVVVKDANGKSYKVTILEEDEDEIEFKVKSAAKGMDYTFAISGIRKYGEKKYVKVTGSFRIPAKKNITVEKVEYDARDKEVSFDFQGKVHWKKAKVTITDSSGKNYVKHIDDKDDDEIEVKVKKLKSGKTYRYKISGIAARGSKQYQTLTGTFKA